MEVFSLQNSLEIYIIFAIYASATNLAWNKRDVKSNSLVPLRESRMLKQKRVKEENHGEPALQKQNRGRVVFFLF